MSLLRGRGAEPIHFPTIEIVEPLSWDEVDAAGDKLQKGNYDWVVFTSVTLPSVTTPDAATTAEAVTTGEDE